MLLSLYDQEVSTSDQRKKAETRVVLECGQGQKVYNDITLANGSDRESETTCVRCWGVVLRDRLGRQRFAGAKEVNGSFRAKLQPGFRLSSVHHLSELTDGALQVRHRLVGSPDQGYVLRRRLDLAPQDMAADLAKQPVACVAVVGVGSKKEEFDKLRVVEFLLRLGVVALWQESTLQQVAVGVPGVALVVKQADMDLELAFALQVLLVKELGCAGELARLDERQQMLGHAVTDVNDEPAFSDMPPVHILICLSHMIFLPRSHWSAGGQAKRRECARGISHQETKIIFSRSMAIRGRERSDENDRMAKAKADGD